ncbi:hypothetical protein [Candidatus Binatus sp.]
MKKRSHHEQSNRRNRSSTTAERHMIAESNAVGDIPESIGRAYERLQSLFQRGGDVSLEELQGAVEYLLDRVKAARGING